MISLLPIFLIAVLPVPAAGADLCQDLIKDIRSRPDVMSGRKSVFEGLSQKPAFVVERMVEHSRPPDDFEQIFSIPGIKAHATLFSGGSAHCRGISFYRTDGAKVQLPDPPVPDGVVRGLGVLEGNGCEGGHNTYRYSFATIHGGPAFLFSQRDTGDFREKIWIAALQNFSWDKGCRVDVGFEPTFPTPHVFMAPDSGLGKDAWIKSAAAIAQAFGSVQDYRDFHFGEAVPEDQKETIAELLNAVEKPSPSDLPHFGTADEEAARPNVGGWFDPVDANARISFRGSVHPLVLNQHPYVLEIGHPEGALETTVPQLGMVLYDWRDGKAVPVASAFIDVKRGPLKSMTVAAP